MICDFCSAADPVWYYRVPHFNVATCAISLSDWLACADCERLIHNDDWTKLARRGLLSNPAKAFLASGGSETELLDAISKLHYAFRSNVQGGPFPCNDATLRKDDGRSL